MATVGVRGLTDAPTRVREFITSRLFSVAGINSRQCSRSAAAMALYYMMIQLSTWLPC